MKYKERDWNEIQAYYNECFSVKEVCKAFNIGTKTLRKAKEKGDFKCRTKEESNKNESRKRKISKSMKIAHKEGRHKGWLNVNKENGDTYSERFFWDLLMKQEIFCEYTFVKKFPFHKYVFDFALVELKIDVEIDGQHHLYDDNTVSKDKERDELSVKEGWKVYRIGWKKLKENPQKTINDFLEYVNSEEKESVVRWKISDIHVEKISFCKDCGKEISSRSIRCQECSWKSNGLKKRKVKRPSKEILEKEIKENSWIALGIKYGVSDNAIRKWAKTYEII